MLLMRLMLLMLGLGQLCALSAFSGWAPPVGYVPMRLKKSVSGPYRP